MSISARQDQILKIVGEETFVTVKDLASLTYTSPSSIRRDLARLQNMGLVKRSHGGVSLPETGGSVAGYYKRATKSIKEKRAIAKKAAALLRDGQNILLDSSTTAGFLLPYIAELHSATVFTNNLETAISAIKLGICTHCLGGCAVNGSVALTGAETYRALSGIHADILFCSSQSLSRDGVISDSTEEENYARLLMMAQAETTVFLCDSTKFDDRSLYTLDSIDSMDYAVFDRPFEGLVTKARLL